MSQKATESVRANVDHIQSDLTLVAGALNTTGGDRKAIDSIGRDDNEVKFRDAVSTLRSTVWK